MEHLLFKFQMLKQNKLCHTTESNFGANYFCLILKTTQKNK